MGEGTKALKLEELTKLPWLPTEPGDYILRVETCPECHGAGFIFNEAWREVDRLVDKKGFAVTEACRIVFGTDDWDEIPLEEEPCWKCNGSTIIYRWVRVDLPLEKQPGRAEDLREEVSHSGDRPDEHRHD